MAEHLTLSPTAWTLLDLLQDQLGVSFEVVHLSLTPLRPPSAADSAGAIDDPGVADVVLQALKTGEIRIDTSRGAPLGVFPLRRAREVVGCLIVLRAGSETTNLARDIRGVENAGHVGRTAVEADLALTSQVAQEQARTRRLHGILRFLGQLGLEGNEQAMMQAVLHAATIWFDLDCRIYHRAPDGGFVLAAALPGAGPMTSQRIEAARAKELLSLKRLASAGDLDDLGLNGRRDEVLVLGVGGVADDPPDRIILLAGVIDPEVELTFAALVRAFAGERQAQEEARVERWHAALASTPAEERRAPNRLGQRLLQSLIADTQATAARLTVVQKTGERVLASEPESPAPSGTPVFVGPVLQTRPDEQIRLALWAPGELDPERTSAIQSWIRAARPWLAQSLAAVSPPVKGAKEEKSADDRDDTFERRIQEEVERAKRFNLGLGLLVIRAERGRSPAPVATMASAVRPALRASDVLGPLRGGRLGVLLVHADTASTSSVTSRLRRRLETPEEGPALSAVRVGAAVFSAECATADALVARAVSRAEELPSRN